MLFYIISSMYIFIVSSILSGLIFTFTVGLFSSLIFVIVNKGIKHTFISNKEEAIKTEILNSKMNFLKNYLDNIKEVKKKNNNRVYDLKKFNIRKSLKNYNAEQRMLLMIKLKIVEEYIIRKKEYIDIYNQGRLDDINKTPEEIALIKELVRNEKNN